MGNVVGPYLYRLTRWIINNLNLTWTGVIVVLGLENQTNFFPIRVNSGIIREQKHAEIQAIGAAAVNQAVKALVLATGYLKNDGINVSCVPEFADVSIEVR